jgi:hypothetical protein
LPARLSFRAGRLFPVLLMLAVIDLGGCFAGRGRECKQGEHGREAAHSKAKHFFDPVR